MAMARVVLVAGTSSWRGEDDPNDWFCPRSPFVDYLRTQQVEPVFATPEMDGLVRVTTPFIWSTDIGGVPFLSRNTFLDWKAGAAALFYYLVAFAKLPGCKTNIICHSHGLQLVLFACRTYGLKINTLISVGSPVRQDMLETATLARPQIRQWIHVYSDSGDRWQWAGELFDGHLGIVRQHPLADENILVPHVGHSALLRDPTTFTWWAPHLQTLGLPPVVNS